MIHNQTNETNETNQSSAPQSAVRSVAVVYIMVKSTEIKYFNEIQFYVLD